MWEWLTDAPHLPWLVGGLLLIGAEMVVPGFFLLWIGGAALVVAGATWALGLGDLAQLGLFSVLAVTAVFLARRWFEAHPIASADPTLNEPNARLVGEIVLVAQPISDGRGRVTVGDGEWTAVGADAPVGTRVRIAEVENGRLRVVPLLTHGDSEEPPRV